MNDSAQLIADLVAHEPSVLVAELRARDGTLVVIAWIEKGKMDELKASFAIEIACGWLRIKEKHSQ